MKLFDRLLLNALVSGVMTSFLWFALTFWVYIETRSVLATSMIGGAFVLFSAVGGMFFGTFVDHHRKHTSMVVASVASLTMYAAATLMYVWLPPEDLLRVSSPAFWAFVALVMAGSVVGNLRAIALSTTVTLLVPEDEHDKANGRIGAAMGVSFTITSVLSGLVIGQLGMGWAMAISLIVTALALTHLLTIRVPEERRARVDGAGPPPIADFRGALRTIRAVPGLGGLIGFAAFNNLAAGLFMSLIDAYGLNLVSVEAWGVLFAVISLGFVVGGLVVAKRGLGRHPMRVVLLGNLVNWTVCSVFTLHSSIVPLAIGMAIWITLVPVIEAAEQTVLQRVVPFDHQGRVFGFAQTVENSASPVVAFMIGPLAQLVVIPFMAEDGSGADLIGDWFGTGDVRAFALIFTTAGLVGLVVTALAWRSRWFRDLSALTSGASHDAEGPDGPALAAGVSSAAP